MIPAAFDYVRPASIDEALELLAPGDPSIRVLAGGQSIVPLMKLRLARPERLVDVGRLSALRGVRELEDGALAVGALTTWASLLGDARITAIGALADALPTIGDVQVRNLGTIGGSLVHADPASDIAAPAIALGFELVAQSAARGPRLIGIDSFFQGAFVSALEPDELLIEVRIPAAARTAGSAYAALPQQASGYPIAGVAIAYTATGLSIGVTGVGDQPYRATEAERAIESVNDESQAMALVADGQQVASDVHADREYRTAMAVVMAQRAFDRAQIREDHRADS